MNILSQYEFRKEIALAWIDPKNVQKSNNRKRTNDEANENSTRNTRSNKRLKKKKARKNNDDSFKQNGNMSYQMSKPVEHELEHGSVTGECCMHRRDADRKAQKISHVRFYPAYNFNVFVGFHKLLRNCKDLLGKKM